MDGGQVERQVTIAIVEDHPVVVEGVTSWVNGDPARRIRIAQVTSDLADLGPGADVIVLDLELGGQMITEKIPALVAGGRRIVVFSAHVDPSIILAVLEAGAYAYVTKDEGRDHLVQTIVAAASDRPHVTRSQAQAMLADTRPGRPALSAQERQALLLWFQGMSKASVGRRMAITENTVRQYIDRARMKYAATGRAAPTKDALLARAIEDGLIRPSEVAVYTSWASSEIPLS
jgi:two-component system, NarL family, nitrate/nitrite response regulator NarL